jgi:predicted homoserine dehydrogenase-like protein
VGNALPISLAEGCVLTHDVKRDHMLTVDDVTMPAERLSDRLWREQLKVWPLAGRERPTMSPAAAQ